MEVTVILVNYNTKELIRECLRSVFEMSKSVKFEVFVVDNASTDGSIEMLEKEFPQVKLIKNSKNIGFGRANNIAIRQSRGKYIFLLNADTVLLNNAIKIFYDFMENPQNHKTACCGGNLYNPDMSPQHSYGKFPSINRIAFTTIGLNLIFKEFYKKTFLVDNTIEVKDIKDVDYITGANMFLRKSALDEVGLFDEDFFMYFEDTELSFRLNQKGFKSMLVPEAKIIHYCGLSGEISLDKLKTFRLSELLYFEKVYGKKIRNLVKFLYSLRYTFHIRFNGRYKEELLLHYRL